MGNPFRRNRPDGQWSVEFDALARAFGGAILFGMPLLFTMEMWWLGEFQPRPHMVGFVLVAFLANMALARMSGFRREEETLANDAAQAVEALAAGVVLSLAGLLALGRIDTGTSLEALFGMIAIQVIPLSLGATVANLVFDPRLGRAGTGSDDDDSPRQELLKDVAATFAGALFLGFAIAPTEEIPMLAASLNGWNMLAIVAFSLLAAYLIVFASGFDPAHRERQVGGLFQGPVSETTLSYVVSLAAAAAMLYGFGQVGSGDPLHSILVQTLVLSVPASIGGAAGRVVV